MGYLQLVLPIPIVIAIAVVIAIAAATGAPRAPHLPRTHPADAPRRCAAAAIASLRSARCEQSPVGTASGRGSKLDEKGEASDAPRIAGRVDVIHHQVWARSRTSRRRRCRRCRRRPRRRSGNTRFRPVRGRRRGEGVRGERRTGLGAEDGATWRRGRLAARKVWGTAGAAGSSRARSGLGRFGRLNPAYSLRGTGSVHGVCTCSRPPTPLWGKQRVDAPNESPAHRERSLTEKPHGCT
eukprot:308094-Chlamydomonas_euryale.AAC.3